MQDTGIPIELHLHHDTLEFCFASSEDCVLLLDPVNRNLDGTLALFYFFNLPVE